MSVLRANDDSAPHAASPEMVVSPDTIRRVALRLMPFLLLCYFISFLDRINVAFAALQMLSLIHI